MRFVFIILFAPIIIVLAVMTRLFAFALSMSAWIFGIAGTVFGLLGLAVLILDNRVNGIIILAFAYLVSPVGLPMLAAWMIGQMQRFRCFVQECIYG